MHTTLTRLVTIAAVCAAALLLCAQATPAASSKPAGPSKPEVNPITGTFSGTDNFSGTVTSWSGSLVFATPLSSDGSCCGLTSGHVHWQVSGTDVNTGCTSSGAGDFAIIDGKIAGTPTSAHAALYPPYYNIDFQTPTTGGLAGYDQFGPVTVTCPGSDPGTSFVTINSWIYGGYGGPYKIKSGGVLRDTDSSINPDRQRTWSWNFQGSTCPQPNAKTGKGYDGLSSTMKERLSTLYSILDTQNACYRFVIGFRDKTVQQDLFDRWHQIADHHRNQPGTCPALHAAGFAQCPTGWNGNGTAQGGPAKPGSSRHEHAEAADIKVTFPAKYAANTAKFRAAAHQAGLCGPPNSDPVHIEMPYKTKGQKVATCHFD